MPTAGKSANVQLALRRSLSLPVLVVALGGLAAWGISQSVAVAASFRLLEIVGLLLVIGVGAPGVADAGRVLPEADELVAPEVWSGIMVGAFLAFYAFIGFEDMVNVAEEVRDPQRNLPRAILWSIVVSTLLYLSVAIFAVVSVPSEQLAASDAPLALIYQTLTGREPLVITFIGMLAVINGALIQMIMASRVIYGMAGRGWLPAGLGYVHPHLRTPLIATLLIAVAVLLLALWGTTENLAKATSYALLLVFALTNLALWRLKRRTAQPEGVIDVPRWIPAAGFAASLGFLLLQLLIDLRVF